MGRLWLYARTSLFTLWSCAVSLTSYSQRLRFMSLDQNKEELLVDSFRPDPKSTGFTQWFSAYFGSSIFLNNMYLADFLKANLTKFAATWVKKGHKAASFYFAPEKLQNHTGEGKGKEKKKERKEGKWDEKKSNGCTLSFYNGYFGDSFWLDMLSCIIPYVFLL